VARSTQADRPVAAGSALVRGLAVGSLVGACGLWAYAVMIHMPGTSERGPSPPLALKEVVLRDALRRDVETLAGEIGERNLTRYEGLRAAAEFLSASLASAGYAVRRQEYDVAGKACQNLEVELPGRGPAGGIVIVGGHYDSVEGSPGANDNATGAAAILALARAFALTRPARTLRFVEFVNEEPPYFQTAAMGSAVYARGCRERGERVTAMLSLETIGYYSDQPGSQAYPFPFQFFYPATGNFIGFVGNLASQGLVREVVRSFRHHTTFPAEGVATFSSIPGVAWSDQWAFWQEGYQAVMVTDTAPFRYPYYHSQLDTPDKIQYDHLARVVLGLERVVADLIELGGI